jgi:hypothetical protein
MDPLRHVEEAVSSPHVAYVRRLFDTYRRGGELAVLQMLPADVRWQTIGHAATVCRGVDELRAVWSERLAFGERVEPHPATFEEIGDHVVVSGSARILAGEGRGFRESSLCWVFAFAGDTLRAQWSAATRAEALADVVSADAAAA